MADTYLHLVCFRNQPDQPFSLTVKTDDGFDLSYGIYHGMYVHNHGTHLDAETVDPSALNLEEKEFRYSCKKAGHINHHFVLKFASDSDVHVAEPIEPEGSGYGLEWRRLPHSNIPW